jgi:hypothetical protein
VSHPIRDPETLRTERRVHPEVSSRHIGGMPHVDMCARSGTPALVGCAPRAV